MAIDLQDMILIDVAKKECWKNFDIILMVSFAVALLLVHVPIYFGEVEFYGAL